MLSRNRIIRSFQYVSDIHLETKRKRPKIPVASDNMVLAGDIGNPFDRMYKDYIRYCSFEYENTILVSGNHEYWNTDVHCMEEIDNQIDNVVSNFYFLNNNGVEFDNVCFIGNTLWSQLKPRPKRKGRGRGNEANIKYKGKLVTGTDLTKFHKKDRKWLENSIDTHINNKDSINNTKDIIVVTHYLPSYKLVHPKFNTKRYRKSLDRFYTDLDHMIKPPIIAWVGGHSHCNMNIKVNDVDLMINAYGYSDKTNPNRKIKTFELPITETKD
jgi:predicted phosphohydrolase